MSGSSSHRAARRAELASLRSALKPTTGTVAQRPDVTATQMYGHSGNARQELAVLGTLHEDAAAR